MWIVLVVAPKQSARLVIYCDTDGLGAGLCSDVCEALPTTFIAVRRDAAVAALLGSKDSVRAEHSKRPERIRWSFLHGRKLGRES